MGDQEYPGKAWSARNHWDTEQGVPEGGKNGCLRPKSSRSASNLKSTLSQVESSAVPCPVHQMVVQNMNSVGQPVSFSFHIQPRIQFFNQGDDAAPPGPLLNALRGVGPPLAAAPEGKLSHRGTSTLHTVLWLLASCLVIGFMISLAHRIYRI